MANGYLTWISRMVITALRRYFWAFIVGVMIIWVGVLGSVHLQNKDIGKITLIFPSPDNQTHLKVNSIGELSTRKTSIFSSLKIDPKDTYKEILLSQELRLLMAKQLDCSVGELPAPNITKVPQTPLMHVTMGGESPQKAIEYVNALFLSFQQRISTLKSEYIDNQLITNQQELSRVKQDMKTLHEQTLALQLKYHVFSEITVNTILESLLIAEKQLREKRIKLVGLEQKNHAFHRLLKVTTQQAVDALLLNSDPIVMGYFQERAVILTKLTILSGVQGPHHPDVTKLREQSQQLSVRIDQRLTMLVAGLTDATAQHLLLNTRLGNRADLFQDYIMNDMDIVQLTAEVQVLERDLALIQSEVSDMVTVMDDVKRLEKQRNLLDALYFSLLSQSRAFREDAVSIYPKVALLEGPLLVRSQRNELYWFASLVALIASILWGALVCHYSQRRHSVQ